MSEPNITISYKVYSTLTKTNVLAEEVDMQEMSPHHLPDLIIHIQKRYGTFSRIEIQIWEENWNARV